jgi:uncharacterized protein (TIGR03437 family)
LAARYTNPTVRWVLFIILSAASVAQSVKYTYDAEGRLTKADYGSRGSVAYSYDAAGNLVSRQVQAPTSSNAPVITSVVNGAKFTAGPGIVPGEFISIFASNLGSVDQLSGFPATSFQGDSVLFNGKAAPLFALIASKNQINLVVPTELASGGSVSVQVQNAAGAGPAVQVQLAPADVGIFLVADPSAPSRKNAAMRFANKAWYVMSTAMAAAYGLPPCTGLASNAGCGQPATTGDAVEIYLTGLGAATPNGDATGAPLPTGQVAPAGGNPLYLTVAKPTVTIGGAAATVLFSGLAPGNAGLYQIDVTIPAGVTNGDNSVIVTLGGSSDTASIPIKQ